MKRSDLNDHSKSIDLNAYFIFGAIVLVFLVGMYAIFSPGVQTQGNPACGKIVIATDGSTLRSNVSQTLQEALYFLVVDPLSGKLVEAVRNPYRGPQPNAQIAYLVAGKGEEAVIVGNIDQQSYNILMQFGIRTFGGYTGQAKKVITLYRQARITAQSPMPETLPQPTMQGQPVMQGQPAPVNMQVQQMPQAGMGAQQMQQPGFGAQQMYPGPVYPNAFQGIGPNCPLPARQAWGQAALGIPDADTIRRNNITTQVALTQPPANVANNPLWERAAATMAPAPAAPQQGNITWELAAAQQQAALAQQAAINQQAAAMAQQQGQYIPIAGAQGYSPPSQYPASQYPQANNALSPIAAQVPISNAPAIMSNAQMPHAYRGNCIDCHQIIDAQTNTQNTQNTQPVANQMMWNNMPQTQNPLRVGVGRGVAR